MTEAEWLGCTDPVPMLEFLRGRVSERKLRLFAVGCCRRLGPLLADERSRKALDLVERFADRPGGDGVLGSAHAAAAAALTDAAARAARFAGRASAASWAPLPAGRAAWAYAAEAAAKAVRASSGRVVTTAQVANDAADAVVWSSEGPARAARAAERAAQCRLLRDLVGPFLPPALDPVYMRRNDGCVRKLARALYDGRRFGDLPILADALEEAGCADETILAHCRVAGQHARGCWVLDHLLELK